MTTDTAAAARALPIWNEVVDNDLHGLAPEGVAKVEQFALTLADMSDRELFDACRDWIYGSALMQRFRFTPPDHAMCTLCYNEARRRDGDADIYSRAHKAVMKDHGYT